MKRPIFTPRRALLVVVLLLIISSLLPARAAAWIASRPHGVVKEVTAPVVKILTRLSRGLRPGPRRPEQETDARRVTQLYHEAQLINKRLRNDLDVAHRMIARLSGVKDLEQAFKLKGAMLLPATVSDASLDPTHPIVTIDRGRWHGVRRDMAVADGVHFVGVVASVTPVTATVRLITAPGTALQVTVAPPGTGKSPHQFETLIKLMEGTQYFTVQVGKDKQVTEGDLARLTDLAYPQEVQQYVVGKVRDVAPDSDAPLMYRRIIVEPVPLLRRLDHVFVLVPTP